MRATGGDSGSGPAPPPGTPVTPSAARPKRLPPTRQVSSSGPTCTALRSGLSSGIPHSSLMQGRHVRGAPHRPPIAAEPDVCDAQQNVWLWRRCRLDRASRQSGGGWSGVVPSGSALSAISGVSLDRSLPDQEVAPEDEPAHAGTGERRGRVLTDLAGGKQPGKDLPHRLVA